MIKYYCDRCGKEIKKADTKLRPNEFGNATAYNVDFRMSFDYDDRSFIARGEEDMCRFIPELLCGDCKNDFIKWCKEKRTDGEADNI